MEILKCHYCGHEYVGRTNSLYCSFRCMYRAYMKRKKARGKAKNPFDVRVCPICLRLFQPTVVNQKTCGRAVCHARWMWEKYKRKV